MAGRLGPSRRLPVGHAAKSDGDCLGDELRVVASLI